MRTQQERLTRPVADSRVKRSTDNSNVAVESVNATTKKEECCSRSTDKSLSVLLRHFTCSKCAKVEMPENPHYSWTKINVIKGIEQLYRLEG